MNIKYMLLVVLAILFASCQDNPTPEIPSSGVAPLKISVGTEQMSRTPITGKWFGHGSQINVIMLDKGATTTYNKMVLYQLDRPNATTEGVWVPAGANTALEVKSDIARVLAYYPAEQQVTLSANKQSITPISTHTLDLGENNASALYESFHMALDHLKPAVLTEIFSAKADLDYMTGVGNNVSSQAGQTQVSIIEMKHTKAMVVINMFKEQDYVGDDRLKSIIIANTTTGTTPLKEGSFTLEDNSFSATNQITYRRTMSKFQGGTRFSMLVFPATIAVNDVTMELHVASIRYTLKVPAKRWEAGRVYAYNIKLSANGVELIGGVVVYDWPTTIKLTVDLE